MNVEKLNLEQLFHALGDPTRLGLAERLSRGPASVKDLAAPYDMALPSVMKHLRVMTDGGLVQSKKVGRTRIYHLQLNALSLIDTWVSQRRAAWNERFDRLEQSLLEENNQDN